MPFHLSVGASNKSVLLPFSPGLDYIIAPAGTGRLQFESDDFRVETMGAVAGFMVADAPLAFLFKEREIP